MEKFKKRSTMIGLAAAITVMACTLSGCSDQKGLFTNRTILKERMGNTGFLSGKSGDEIYEKSTETIAAEENVREIYVNTSLVDVIICPAKQKGKSVPEGEILIEKNIGQNTPDVDVSVKNGILDIVQAAEQGNRKILYNSIVYVYLPEDIELENIDIDGKDGDMEIDGDLSVGKMSVELASGDIDIVGNVSISSDLHIETVNGTTEIETVSCGGSLNLYTESGDIEFFGNVQENMSVKTGDGDVMISGTVHGVLQVNTCIGRIGLDDVTCSKNLDLYSDSGDIEFSGNVQGNMSVETGNGDVIVSDTVDGTLQVNTCIGKIELDDVIFSGSLDLYSDSGDIEFSGEAEGALKAETGSGDIDIDGIAGDDLTLTTCVGNVSVNLEGNAWDYNYDISSESGNLYLNEEFYSESPNIIKRQNNVNGDKITVSTESGDIDIEIEE